MFLSNRPFNVGQHQSKPSGPMHFLKKKKQTWRIRTNTDNMIEHVSVSLLTEQAPSPIPL